MTIGISQVACVHEAMVFAGVDESDAATRRGCIAHFIDSVATLVGQANITSLDTLGGTGRLVKLRHLAWVSSMKLMASVHTMQAAVSSVKPDVREK